MWSRQYGVVHASCRLHVIFLRDAKSNFKETLVLLKTMKSKAKVFSVFIERDSERYFVALVPALRGWHT
jgi:hypothetical protein